MLLMRFQTWLDSLKLNIFQEVFKKHYKMSPTRYAKKKEAIPLLNWR